MSAVGGAGVRVGPDQLGGRLGLGEAGLAAARGVQDPLGQRGVVGGDGEQAAVDLDGLLHVPAPEVDGAGFDVGAEPDVRRRDRWSAVRHGRAHVGERDRATHPPQGRRRTTLQRLAVRAEHRLGVAGDGSPRRRHRCAAVAPVGGHLDLEVPPVLRAPRRGRRARRAAVGWPRPGVTAAVATTGEHRGGGDHRQHGRRRGAHRSPRRTSAPDRGPRPGRDRHRRVGLGRPLAPGRPAPTAPAGRPQSSACSSRSSSTRIAASARWTWERAVTSATSSSAAISAYSRSS